MQNVTRLGRFVQKIVDRGLSPRFGDKRRRRSAAPLLAARCKHGGHGDRVPPMKGRRSHEHRDANTGICTADYESS